MAGIFKIFEKTFPVDFEVVTGYALFDHSKHDNIKQKIEAIVEYHELLRRHHKEQNNKIQLENDLWNRKITNL